jgi:hypothetical protein
MITALKKLYEEHARNCFHEAASVGDPRRRELLLKLAREWTEDAEAWRMRSTEREDLTSYRAASSAHAGRCHRGAKSGTPSA